MTGRIESVFVDPPDEMYEITQRRALDHLTAAAGFFLVSVKYNPETGDGEYRSFCSSGKDLNLGTVMACVEESLVAFFQADREYEEEE